MAEFRKDVLNGVKDVLQNIKLITSPEGSG